MSWVCNDVPTHTDHYADLRPASRLPNSLVRNDMPRSARYSFLTSLVWCVWGLNPVAFCLVGVFLLQGQWVFTMSSGGQNAHPEAWADAQTNKVMGAVLGLIGSSPEPLVHLSELGCIMYICIWCILAVLGMLYCMSHYIVLLCSVIVLVTVSEWKKKNWAGSALNSPPKNTQTQGNVLR